MRNVSGELGGSADTRSLWQPPTWRGAADQLRPRAEQSRYARPSFCGASSTQTMALCMLIATLGLALWSPRPREHWAQAAISEGPVTTQRDVTHLLPPPHPSPHSGDEQTPGSGTPSERGGRGQRRRGRRGASRHGLMHAHATSPGGGLRAHPTASAVSPTRTPTQTEPAAPTVRRQPALATITTPRADGQRLHLPPREVR